MRNSILWNGMERARGRGSDIENWRGSGAGKDTGKATEATQEVVNEAAAGRLLEASPPAGPTSS